MPIDEQSGKEYIPLDKIVIEHNVRTDSQQDVALLAEQIRQAGRLLEPIVVRKEGHEYRLVAGHRRLEALKILGWNKLFIGEHIKIIPEKLEELDFQILNYIENAARIDPLPLEDGRLFDEWQRKFGLSNQAISVKIGGKLSSSDVGDRIQAYREVPVKYHKAIGTRHGIQKDRTKMPFTSVLSVMRAKGIPKKDKDPVYDAIQNGEITVRDLDLLTQLMRNGMTVYRAIEESKLYRLTYLAVPVRKLVADDMEREHKMSITQILLHSIKFKTPHIPPDLIYLEGVKIAEKKKKKGEVEEVTG